MWIVHRCSRCGKPDIWTQGDPKDGTVATRKCCGGTWRPPELMRRWCTATNQPVTDVLEPGGRTETTSVTSCTCQACQQLYADHPQRSAA